MVDAVIFINLFPNKMVFAVDLFKYSRKSVAAVHCFILLFISILSKPGVNKKSFA